MGRSALVRAGGSAVRSRHDRTRGRRPRHHLPRLARLPGPAPGRASPDDRPRRRGLRAGRPGRAAHRGRHGRERRRLVQPAARALPDRPPHRGRRVHRPPRPHGARSPPPARWPRCSACPPSSSSSPSTRTRTRRSPSAVVIVSTLAWAGRLPRRAHQGPAHLPRRGGLSACGPRSSRSPSTAVSVAAIGFVPASIFGFFFFGFVDVYDGGDFYGGPDFTTIGLISIAVGVAYVLAQPPARPRGYHGASTPFVPVAILALAQGVAALGRGPRGHGHGPAGRRRRRRPGRPRGHDRATGHDVVRRRRHGHRAGHVLRRHGRRARALAGCSTCAPGSAWSPWPTRS